MVFIKKSQSTLGGSAQEQLYMMTHPDMGTLMHAVMLENSIDQFERKTVLERMARDTGYADPTTPLTGGILSRLGGGMLGMLVSRLIGNGNMGMPGNKALGSIICDYYLREADMENNNTRVII